jgi:hypothetical protein
MRGPDLTLSISLYDTTNGEQRACVSSQVWIRKVV